MSGFTTGHLQVYFSPINKQDVTHWLPEAKLAFIVEMLNKGWIIKADNTNGSTIIYWGA